MRNRLIVSFLLAVTAAVILFATVTGGTAAAASDPDCSGYPEPRIYLENQSWWTPQFTNPADPLHPGTGQIGHIHVGTCFPLYQKVRGTMHLDVTVKLHNMTGNPGRIIAGYYGDRAGPDLPVVPRCVTADCTYTIPIDVPQSQILYSGWREFQVYVPVFNADGTKQYNVPRWSVYVDRPDLPPSPTAGVCPACVEDVGGDSWYRSGGSAYARVDLLRSSVPWNETTGQLTPVSGLWQPQVNFRQPGGFAYVDPAFHATPPSKGTIVYEGSGSSVRTLTIDTTQLSNGVHHLVLGSSLDSAASSVGPAGTNTGVLVVPFLVHNPVCT